MIVTAGIHDAFVEAMVSAMKALRVGHALEDATQIGPVVDESQLKRTRSTCRSVDRGREVAWARAPQRDTDGFYSSPALLVS
jgi:aldehyde dehydrogenase (NAD+)